MSLSLFEQEISALRQKGRYRRLMRMSTPQDRVVVIDGKRLLNFSSNNYLGLANHPDVVEAFAGSARKYGMGAGASRLIGGNTDIHVELEEALARFKGTEASLTFSSGYLANLGILATLGGPGATIFSDELNHASIVDGCRLSRSRVEIYRHADAGHLEDLLKASRAGRKIIVTDGVFSMGGDIAPLRELAALKARHGAILVVDDAHATGTLPPRGRGTAEYFGLAGQIDIQMGTFSKALGTCGAYLCASRAVVEYFVNKCRTFIFNTGLPPAVAGATIRSIELLTRHPEWLAALAENGETFRREMEVLGRFLSSPTPIIPIEVGTDEKTMSASQRLYDRGLFVHGIRPPSVPEGRGLLRLTLMATHTADMVRTAARRIDESLKESEIEPN
ncbi:MAG: 8-amino-7-oxononanoate synthase [Thermodesulfobacteriota bacterium]